MKSTKKLVKIAAYERYIEMLDGWIRKLERRRDRYMKKLDKLLGEDQLNIVFPGEE